jgi:hypothetical protein
MNDQGTTYNCVWKGWWLIAFILAAVFVSPWFLLGLWPLPAKWSKHLPSTYTKDQDQ